MWPSCNWMIAWSIKRPHTQDIRHYGTIPRILPFFLFSPNLWHLEKKGECCRRGGYSSDTRKHSTTLLCGININEWLRREQI
jgi:hypothetical protein